MEREPNADAHPQQPTNTKPDSLAVLPDDESCAPEGATLFAYRGEMEPKEA